MINKYKQNAIDKNLNIYFICEGNQDYSIKKVVVNKANPNCNCYSVAKAFTVLAIGMLYDKGLIKPDDLLTKIINKHLPDQLDPLWHKVTIHHVLLHKIGFDKGLLDIDCDDASLYETNDYLQMVLNTKLAYEPGSKYQYTDAAYYLLSRVVYEVSGKDLSDFLRPVLMDKLRFKEFAWSKCPYGYSMGATGLYIRTEDMIKLGILFLNKGKWMDEQIVSQEWIDLVISNRYEFTHVKDGWYAKGGMCGQLLMFNFELGKAIACHSYESRIPYDIFIDTYN